MFTNQATPTTVNQSKDVLSNLTDNQREYLQSFKSVFFDPENDQEECLELLKDYKEGWEKNEPKESVEDLPDETDDFEDESTFKECTITGDKLVQISADSIPHLWHPYFPTTGLVGISGASEAGKSTFARQLALAICNDDKSFLNHPLFSEHKSVLYISTEDDQTSMSVLLKKQTVSRYTDGLKRFKLGLNVADIFLYIQKELNKEKVDLVVIDVWSDLYGESPNDFSKVRRNLNRYSKLCMKYKTCICIIHHNTKHSKDNEPSKTNLNGSQAIEAKLRTLLELRESNGNSKQLSILKGNYIPFELKKKRLILSQGKDLNLDFLSEQEYESEQGKQNQNSNDSIHKERAIQLYTIEGYSQQNTCKVLEKEFGDKAPSYGKMNAWLKGLKRGQTKKV